MVAKKMRACSFGFLKLSAAAAMTAFVWRPAECDPFLTFTKTGDPSVSMRLAPFVTTHWNGSAVAIGTGDVADRRIDAYEKDTHPNDNTLLPAYDNYHMQVTAGTAVSIASSGDAVHFDINTRTIQPGVNDVADGIDYYIDTYWKEVSSSATKYGSNPPLLDILNWGDYAANNYYLLSGSPNIQVLNNVKIGTHCLATITFPPGWSPSGYWDAAISAYRKYPVVLHGNGYGISDNNTQYTPTLGNAYDPRDPINTAMAYNLLPSNKGIICVYLNSGGREALGLNQGVLDDITSFFTNVVPAYGGDPNRVVTFGASRGGGEAATWATLTSGLNVRAFLSAVAPMKFGSTASLSHSSYPSLKVDIIMLGSLNAWKTDYANLNNTTKAQAVSGVIMGTNVLSEADAASPSGKLSAAADAGSLAHKFLHFAFGSHDSFFPLPYYLEMDEMLTAKGIPHSSLLGYAMGHSVTYDYTYFTDALANINVDPAPVFTGVTRKFIVPDEITYGADPDQKNAIVISSSAIATINSYRPTYFSDGANHNPGALGFAATVPYRIVAGKPFEIALCGETGKWWKITARDDDGYGRKFEASGQFGSSADPTFYPSIASPHLEKGQEFIFIRDLSMTDLGNLEWFFEYDGREVPNRFTPYVSNETPSAFLRATSVIVATENSTDMPNGPDSYFRANRITVGNGVSQYHPLLFKPNAVAAFGTIPDATLYQHLGGNAELTLSSFITTPDADGDPLRYDLRMADGGYITGATMDRSTGHFSVPLSALPIGGPYAVRAIATDGKGGTATKDFNVTVNP